MTKYIFLVAALIGLASCEKETSVGYIINNNSSTEIYVNGMNVIYSEPVSYTVPAMGGSEILARWSKTGKETSPQDPAMIFGNSLLITNTSGDTLIPDPALVASWTSDVQETSGTAAHTYVLNVTDVDF